MSCIAQFFSFLCAYIAQGEVVRRRVTDGVATDWLGRKISVGDRAKIKPPPRSAATVLSAVPP